MQKQSTVEELVEDVLGGRARIETVKGRCRVPERPRGLDGDQSHRALRVRSRSQQLRDRDLCPQRKAADKGQGELIKNWRTIPRVADGIRKKLNSETVRVWSDS